MESIFFYLCTLGVNFASWDESEIINLILPKSSSSEREAHQKFCIKTEITTFCGGNISQNPWVISTATPAAVYIIC